MVPMRRTAWVKIVYNRQLLTLKLITRVVVLFPLAKQKLKCIKVRHALVKLQLRLS